MEKNTIIILYYDKNNLLAFNLTLTVFMKSKNNIIYFNPNIDSFNIIIKKMEN